MNTMTAVAVRAEPTSRSILRSGLSAAALSVPATLAAYVVGLLIIDRPANFGRLLAVAMDLVFHSALMFVPIAAVVGLAVGALIRWAGATATLVIGTSLAVFGGGLSGWLLLHNAPAAPLGLAVRVVALAWGACAALSLAFVASRGQTT